MTTLETSRLLIRNFREDDWRDLQEIIIHYQESEYARYDHPWPTATDKIKDIVRWFAQGDDYLAVCLKTTGRLIGFLAINQRQDQQGRVHNLGYVFNQDYQGQGYAFEACRFVLDEVFCRLGIDRILTGTHPANQPSVLLLEKLGLQRVNENEFTISKQAWLAREQVGQTNKYPPKGLLRLGFRLPVYFYRCGLGWLLGRRFVLINHLGRKTGLPRQAVVEVVERDPASGEVTVVAGYGSRTQWYQNLRAHPDTVIQVGSRKIPVTAEFVTPQDGEEIMARYLGRYGKLTGGLFSVLGYTWDGSEAGVRQIARQWLRFVRFVPRL